MRAVHVIVTGRVQGVGYRAWCAGRAKALGLGGWVRNRRSGEVEAAFSGPDDAVAAILEACERGPALARVDAVRIISDAPTLSATTFDVLATL
ncbi:MAG: acylphosphatase [Hyphomicrobiales bacterium]|nr:MAG: acylphosphatase [Hyphomicrobiales bacterium]